MGKAFRSIVCRTSLTTVLLASSCFAQCFDFPRQRLVPPNEEAIPPSLKKILGLLQGVVSQRDVSAFRQVMAESIKVSNGPLFDQSPIEFLQLENPESPAWGDLEVLLMLKGRFITPSETLYCKPHIHQAFPEWARGSPDYKVVINSDGKLHANPSLNDSLSRNISYEIVNSGITHNVDNQVSELWSKVKTFDGEVGYVKTAYLWGQYDPVLCFSQGSEGWAIEIFISSLD